MGCSLFYFIYEYIHIYEYIIYYLLIFEIFLINKKGAVCQSDVDNLKPVLLGGCDDIMISEVASLLF